VLYNFCLAGTNCTDGELPETGLVFDADGNLYGATLEGGAYGYGAVFQLAPDAGGGWTETVVYSFCSAGWPCSDGAYPYSGSLVFDADGSLYGTTTAGGGYQMPCGGTDCGTVFELSPVGDGTWTETVLHSFGNGNDGRLPAAPLIFDANGNLYGTTVFGGATYKKGGTAFELTPSTGGTWTETILHNFCSAPACADGGEPSAGLIFDAAGTLYGTTTLGGSHQLHCNGEGCGVVFELTPGSNGKWKERTLHSFIFSDGSNPGSSLIFDAAGNLYGKTSAGGPQSAGTIFELTRGNNGAWKEKVLNKVGGSNGSLVFDAAGNLYDAIGQSGKHPDGSVFELKPSKNGKWTQKVLFSFNGQDGAGPGSSLIFDSAGNVYGVTGRGGASGSGCGGRGCGTVFEITP
jgi:uncharacterized repeat protein (TIGR03803 family)